MSIILLILAAIFKAIADTLQHHYYDSVFVNYNSHWWNPAISWQHVKFLPLTKYRPDAWHLANSAMIVFMVAAIVFHHHYFAWWVEIIIGGIIWNLTFNLFYNKILR